MRQTLIAVLTATRQINKARVTGKLSLITVAKLNLLKYYITFCQEQLAIGDEQYFDKLKELNKRFEALVNSCPDIICNLRETTCTSGELINNTNINNPYRPQLPTIPTEPEPEPNNSPAIIDDNSITVDKGTTTLITLGMIPYSDPDGDLLDAIRIDKIHTTNEGIFYVSGVPVVEGQIITREQIEGEQLYHIGANIDTITSDSFDFSARDEGTMIWVQ